MMCERYDLFLISGKTRNSLPFAVGGFCRKETASACCEKASAAMAHSFPQTTDPLLVDAYLHHLLQQVGLPETAYIAASIASPYPKEPCGGICGKWPDDGVTAADGMLHCLEEGVYGFAIPGVCACIMAGESDKAEQAHRCAVQITQQSAWDRTTITRYLAKLSACEGQLLFVTDGSAGIQGCVSVITDHSINTAWLTSTSA